MSSDRDEKVDILDLLINLLKEHETKLDELAYRIETILDENLPEPESPESTTRESPPGELVTLRATIRRWHEFRQRCRRSDSVAFQAHDGQFKVTAVSRNALYTYEEEIPFLEILYTGEGEERKPRYFIEDPKLLTKALRGRLDCGLELEGVETEVDVPDNGMYVRIKYPVNPGEARDWIAEQLGIEPSTIIEGELDIL